MKPTSIAYAAIGLIAYLRKTYGIDVDQLDVQADAGGKE